MNLLKIMLTALNISIFIGTVQHFLPPGFKKCCTVPIKPIFLADALGRLKKIVFFWSYWDSTAFFTKKIGFIGTVQHFLPLGFKKCCTVPIKPIFLADALGRLKKIVFLVLLGQYSIFHQKDRFYWDSTAFFKAQRQKVLYRP